MNQIQEKDWAEDSWHGHTGIDSTCDYCIVDGDIGTKPTDNSAATADHTTDGKALNHSPQSDQSNIRSSRE